MIASRLRRHKFDIGHIILPFLHTIPDVLANISMK